MIEPTPLRDDAPSCSRPASAVVLYVEDHPVNLMLMQALFSRRPSVRLVAAATAEEGYRCALDMQPDLLLLDLRLPDSDGTQLLARIRSHGGLSKVPAVAVTAEDDELIGTGFLEAWIKPLDMPWTLARLDTLLGLPATGADTAGRCVDMARRGIALYHRASRTTMRSVPRSAWRDDCSSEGSFTPSTRRATLP